MQPEAAPSFSDEARRFLRHFESEDKTGGARNKAPGMLTTHAKNVKGDVMYAESVALDAKQFTVTAQLVVPGRSRPVSATGTSSGPKLAKKEAALLLLQAELQAMRVDSGDI